MNDANIITIIKPLPHRNLLRNYPFSSLEEPGIVNLERSDNADNGLKKRVFFKEIDLLIVFYPYRRSKKAAVVTECFSIYPGQK